MATNPVAIVRNTDYFNQLVESINRVVTEDFAAAAEYAQIFEDQRVITSLTRWDVEGIGQGTRPRRTDGYESTANWKTTIERLKIGQVVGVLNVDSRPLATRCCPSRRVPSTTSRLCCWTAREKRPKVLASHQPQREAQQTSRTLDDFVQFGLVHLTPSGERAAQRQAAARTRCRASQRDVKVPTKDQVVTDDLAEAVAAWAEDMNG